MISALKSWDIFCAVVDNYGDIGVCWRLARQLVAEHGLTVRLWVDDLSSLQRLCPEVSPEFEMQILRGVEVRRWSKPFPDVVPADVVIEAFACELPENYLAAMVASKTRAVWINLEYLSAENWVPGFHGASSPHPSLPLTKYFYFPGFISETGGLLREHALGGEFDAAAFWHTHRIPQPQANELRISLFSYENAAIKSLLDAWSAHDYPVICLLPEGRLSAQVFAWFGQRANVMQRGNLTIYALPFMEQDEYDRLLWACDLNFVRGEDSFVRAQWAAKPFVWHIYPQQEDAHWPKLDAFLDLYCKGMPAEASSAVQAFWHGWNRGSDMGDAWAEFWKQFAVIAQHTQAWSASLMGHDDLAAKLVFFCKNKV